MRYTVPDYYNRFHCIAGDCPDTCCAGWAIMIDEKSLHRYKKLNTPFGNRLRNSIDWEESSFCQFGHRCAFLNEDNLCDIYSEAGPGFLCRTCRNYPRHIEEFEGIREISLSLSCPEAARLILENEDRVRFFSKEDEREEMYPDFDFFLFTKLVDTRKVIFSILQNRKQKRYIRMGMALALSHDFQQRIRSGRLYQTDELLERYKRVDALQYFKKKLEGFCAAGEERYRRMRQMFLIFSRLEVLKEDWPVYVAEAADRLFAGGAGEYTKQQRAFSAYLLEIKERAAMWERLEEQLLVYFVFTYFAGAVYDGRGEEKVKLAVVSTLLIQELSKAFWIENGKLEFQDFCSISCRYSREVEHSDSNLNILEQIFNREENFSLDSLLRLIVPMRQDRPWQEVINQK